MPIPNCTGPYNVGCVDIMTKDKSIPKDFHDPYAVCHAELGSFFRLFYPCANVDVSQYKQATWTPEPNQKLYAYAFMKHLNISPRWFGWLSHLLTKNIKMHAYEDVPVIDQESWQVMQNLPHLKKKSNFPLVLFSHGLGGQRAMYSVFCTQLASEGFIVAAVEHRDTSSTSSYVMSNNETIEVPYYITQTVDDGDKERFRLRNTQLKQRTREMMAALDTLEALNNNPASIQNMMTVKFDLCTLKDRIDVACPLIMGHSFGGATMLNTLKKDPRLKCGIGLDVWFVPLSDDFYKEDASTDKPVLLINTERFNWKKNLARCEKYINNTTKDYVEFLTLRGTGHMDQTDVPGVVPQFIASWIVKKHPEQMKFADAIHVQRKIILDYFGKYLQRNETPVRLLDEHYELDDVFMVGSNITLTDADETES